MGQPLYSLDIKLKCSNVAVLEGAANAIPSSDDPRVYGDLYDKPVVCLDVSGDYHRLVCMIRLNEEAELINLRATIKSLNGVIAQCLPGSYIKGHKCYNHLPMGERQPCEFSDIFIDEVT